MAFRNTRCRLLHRKFAHALALTGQEPADRLADGEPMATMLACCRARRWMLAVTLLPMLAGCASGARPSPTYSADDLKRRCEAAGHWWRPDVAGGYCEQD